MTAPMRGRPARLLRSLAVPVLLLGGWYLVASANLVSPLFLPSPATVASAFKALWESDKLVPATLYTLASVVTGWLISCIGGVVLAILITRSRFVVEAASPLMDFARSLPAAALIPPATLLFGYGRAMELPIVVVGAIWPVLLNAVQGLSDNEPQLKEVARSIQMSRVRRIISIELPSALPSILLGVRTALSVAVIVAVVAEMVGSSGGLGYELLLASQRFQSGTVYALVFLLGVIGVMANVMVYALESRVTTARRPLQ